MAKIVKVNDFEQAVHDVLEEYFDGIATDSTELVANVAVETVQELQRTSPKNKGNYQKSWRIRQNKKLKAVNEVEVYNTKHQLTHLLEHGHLKVVHNTVLGFTPARPHIALAEQHAIRKLLQGIERNAR